MTNYADILPALLQIPFILAFIWFALSMSRDYRQDAKSRDEHWMNFLSLERRERKSAVEQGMNEIRQVTGAMVKLTKAIAELAQNAVDHNTGAIGRHKNVVDEMRRNREDD